MSTNYPVAADSYTRPGASDVMNSPGHAAQHDNAYDAIEAIEAKLGIGSSTPVADRFLVGTAVGTSAWTKVVPSGVVVGDSDTQTLTNKTLTTPIITSPTVTGGTLTKPTVNGSASALTTDVDGATITFSMAASNSHQVTLGGNRNLAVSNVTTGQWFNIDLIQDGGGNRTVVWFSGISWADGVTPTLTTTASKRDSFVFHCIAGDTYVGYIAAQNL